MSKPLRLALVGATGLIGTALRERLAESELQPAELILLASDNSAGQRLEYRGRHLSVKDAAGFDFAEADVAVLAVPPAAAATLAPKIAATSCRLLDYSGVFLADLEVPLVCPGVSVGSRAQVVSLPGAIAAQVAGLLAGPVADELLAAVNITALLPAGLAGRAGLDELAGQTAALLNVQQPAMNVFADCLAFQVQAAGSRGQGSSHQAPGQGAALALKRLLGLALPVSCQAYWVPVFHGTTLDLSLTFHEEIDAGRMQAWLEDAGIALLPVDDAARATLPEGTGAGIQAGMQKDVARDGRHWRIWLAADSVQLLALMGVQTIEILIKDHLY